MAPRSPRKTRWGALMLRSACAAASLALASPAAAAGPNERPSEERRRHLAPSDSIGDVLNHPAFAGFARLLLPWDERAYDPGLPLTNIGSLLPYHTRVDPAVVARSLNRMIDDVNADKPVFYAFPADEKRAHTGLFLFRGRPGAPFAVIAPGGGFAYVGSVHEGFPYAEEISRQGYNAFVLKYRAGQGGGAATEDLAAALSYIMKNADALGVSTRDYSLWGSSAGARMAAAIGSHGAARFGGSDLPKPATVVIAYTGHSDHSRDEPPTYVVVGEHDGIAPPTTMERRVATLRKAGTEVAFRVFKGLGHGFGIGNGTSADGWIADAVRFWEQSMTTPINR
jgi:acetyl esterase/lipase